MFHPDAPLTNQHLNDRFKSPFALLIMAIKRAKQAVRSGHGLSSHGKILNPAYQILDQIDDEMGHVECSSCEKSLK